MKKFFTILISAFLLHSCTKAPEPIEPIPSPKQIAWHQMETYAFVHFGLNTFNDLEWGEGDTPASTFNPTDLDCEQWAATLKACGMKGVILTAKHHDGFCLWPTKSTDYNISKSPYKNGNGDLVRELSDACRKYGLRFGIYLSPWDRNNAEYGFPGYVETYHQQINELTSNYGPLFEFWFDGANGGTGYYGGANERRSINAREYYDYQRAKDTIINRHPDAMIFGGPCQTIRWVGNEQGWAGATNWAMLSDDDNYNQLTYGSEDGGSWIPAEVDVSIRPGWFYHQREDHQLKTLAKLVDIYYNSVGHNANLLLNFPVGLSGRIYPQDSLRAMEFYQTISNELKDNLLLDAKVYADDERGHKFSASKVNDGNPETFWATNDDYPFGSIAFKFEKPVMINRVLLQEYIALGQRVKSFYLEGELDGKWFKIPTYDTTSTIGYKRIVRFNTVELDKLVIYFDECRGPLCISNIEAYYAPALLSEPTISRNYDNIVTIESPDKNAAIYYTVDGSTPIVGGNAKKYDKPFIFKDKGVIKAVSFDVVSGKSSAISTKTLPLPHDSFKVISPENGFNKIYDGSGFSVTYLMMENAVVELEYNEIQAITGFSYLPSQGRDASRHINEYEFFVDEKLVSKGAFGNIKNNPIEQFVSFEPVSGKRVKFVAKGNTDNAKSCNIAEFEIFVK
ncbi:MAG: alpha-L-fucosidase [Bacteroidales bacterium]|nr:alpha-L-fucosidase [Bacteroidales bacterium]